MNTLKLLASQRDQAARLYGLYAAKFTGYTSFWQCLVEEGGNAAAFIRMSVPAAGVASPPVEAIDSLARLVDIELKIAYEPRLSLLHAFTAAFEIEQKILEVASLLRPEAMPTEVRNSVMHIQSSSGNQLEQVRLAMANLS